MEVLDLFSAAAGGWSLGMHRAGFKTIAACENVAWRRALYQENNPDVLIYDDVCTLTADRIIRDTGRFPPVVVGSPPCQDISSANTKGKGVEGERSGLYFEAIRIIGEGRPRWFALENSSNLRTRGADSVLSALEALGYACWTFVVRAGDIGANHERPRSWIIGCDPQQVADANGFRWDEGRGGGGAGSTYPFRKILATPRKSDADRGFRGGRASATPGAEQSACRDAPDADRNKIRISVLPGRPSEEAAIVGKTHPVRDDADAAEKRPERITRGYEWRGNEITERAYFSARPEMGLCQTDRDRIAEWRADWSLNDLAAHLQLDDGLSAWLADTRVALGTPKGTSAASLIVEAFGDAVVPQIPEAIGKAILRTEQALSAIYGRSA